LVFHAVKLTGPRGGCNYRARIISEGIGLEFEARNPGLPSLRSVQPRKISAEALNAIWRQAEFSGRWRFALRDTLGVTAVVALFLLLARFMPISWVAGLIGLAACLLLVCVPEENRPPSFNWRSRSS